MIAVAGPALSMAAPPTGQGDLQVLYDEAGCSIRLPSDEMRILGTRSFDAVGKELKVDLTGDRTGPRVVLPPSTTPGIYILQMEFEDGVRSVRFMHR